MGWRIVLLYFIYTATPRNDSRTLSRQTQLRPYFRAHFFWNVHDT